MNRRTFLAATPALLSSRTLAAESTSPRPPAVTRPRATAGDSTEPKWEQRLKITVGTAKADLVGPDHRVIQAAVDNWSLPTDTDYSLVNTSTGKAILPAQALADVEDRDQRLGIHRRFNNAVRRVSSNRLLR